MVSIIRVRLSLSLFLSLTTISTFHNKEGVYIFYKGGARDVMVKAMDCWIVVSEFELQPRYYVHFRTNTLGKGINPLILPVMGYIVQLLFFSNDGFGIK